MAVFDRIFALIAACAIYIVAGLSCNLIVAILGSRIVATNFQFIALYLMVPLLPATWSFRASFASLQDRRKYRGRISPAQKRLEGFSSIDQDSSGETKGQTSDRWPRLDQSSFPRIPLLVTRLPDRLTALLVALLVFLGAAFISNVVFVILARQASVGQQICFAVVLLCGSLVAAITSYRRTLAHATRRRKKRSIIRAAREKLRQYEAGEYFRRGHV